MSAIRRTPAAVPSHRASRLLHLGGLAASLASGILAEEARRAARGTLPQARELLLTPDNAARLADKLSRLRDGRRLAVKVHYPGVARSIDRDVDNMAALLRLLPLPGGARVDAAALPGPRLENLAAPSGG